VGDVDAGDVDRFARYEVGRDVLAGRIDPRCAVEIDAVWNGNSVAGQRIDRGDRGHAARDKIDLSRLGDRRLSDGIRRPCAGPVPTDIDRAEGRSQGSPLVDDRAVDIELTGGRQRELP